MDFFQKSVKILLTNAAQFLYNKFASNVSPIKSA